MKIENMRGKAHLSGAGHARKLKITVCADAE